MPKKFTRAVLAMPPTAVKECTNARVQHSVGCLGIHLGLQHLCNLLLAASESLLPAAGEGKLQPVLLKQTPFPLGYVYLVTTAAAAVVGLVHSTYTHTHMHARKSILAVLPRRFGVRGWGDSEVTSLRIQLWFN